MFLKNKHKVHKMMKEFILNFIISSFKIWFMCFLYFFNQTSLILKTPSMFFLVFFKTKLILKIEIKSFWMQKVIKLLVIYTVQNFISFSSIRTDTIVFLKLDLLFTRKKFSPAKISHFKFLNKWCFPPKWEQLVHKFQASPRITSYFHLSLYSKTSHIGPHFLLDHSYNEDLCEPYLSIKTNLWCM